MREWMALLSAELAGRLRGYWTPLLSDAAQAVACVFLFGVIAPLGVQDGAPYWVWLAAGLAPWFFYENALLGSANAYFSYAPLVRHRQCHSALIPPLRVAGALLHAQAMAVACRPCGQRDGLSVAALVSAALLPVLRVVARHCRRLFCGHVRPRFSGALWSAACA